MRNGTNLIIPNYMSNDGTYDLVNSLDGARNAGKLARSVWSRGKAGDHIKRLPIADDRNKNRKLLLC